MTKKTDVVVESVAVPAVPPARGSVVTEVALFMLTVLLYLNALKAEFVYDDVTAVVENKVNFQLKLN